nr:MAG TPA: head to tail adaptor [Caudoviricetes sp.]
MLSYATVDEFLRFDPTTPLADQQKLLARLLAHASGLVRHATRRAIYTTTPNGLPKDPDLLEAMQEATMVHVQALSDAGLAQAFFTGGATLDATVSSSSIDGASVTVDTSTADSARAALLAGGLAPDAEMILRDAGLLGGLPGIVYRCAR